MLCCTGQCRDRSCSPSTNPCNNNNNNNNASVYFKLEDYFGPEMKRAHSDDSTVSPSTPATKVKCDSAKRPAPPELIADVTSKSSRHCKVFLGGSCNPTTWRQDIAIPVLSKLGLTYYNPQVSSWTPDLIAVEHDAKTNAEVLFYVINNQTRGTVASLEVVHAVAKGRKVILVLSGFKPGQKICDDVISQKEYEELTVAQQIVRDIVERHGIPVFNDIHAALHCTAKVIQERIRPQDLKLSDLAQLFKLENLSASNLKLWIRNNLRKTFDVLDVHKSGEIGVLDFPKAFEILMKRALSREDIEGVLDSMKKCEKDVHLPFIPAATESINGTRSHSTSNNRKENGVNGYTNGTSVLNFEQFCCMMAEIIYRNQNKINLTGCNGSASIDQLYSKSSTVMRNVILVLTKLLDNFPGSKPVVSNVSACELNGDVTQTFDVYLGGPQINAEDSWSRNVAVPLLKKHGLSYVIPEVSNGSKRLHVPLLSEIDKSRLIFFYIPGNSRSLDLCLLVVLCMEDFQKDALISDEKLSSNAAKDYMRVRSYLSDMANRDGVRVFRDLPDALHHVIEEIERAKSIS